MASAREQELEDQIELLNQKVEGLTGSSQELGVLMALGRGMTSRLATILFILVRRSPAVISKTALHTVIYGDAADGGPDPGIFNVHISRLRGVLRRNKCPGKIDTVWNAGFRADPALVKWVKEKYAKGIPQE